MDVEIFGTMGMSARDLWYALGISGLLVALILFLLAINSFLIEPWKKRRKVSQRLAEVSHQHLEQIRLLKEKLEGRSDRIAAILGTSAQKLVTKMQSQLLKADIFWDPLTFIGLALFLGATGFFIGIYGVKSFFVGVILACGMALIPYWHLKRKKKRKTLQFEAQLPEAMELLSRSLHAGHTLPSAIELLSGEMAPPLSTEMLIAFEEQRFGIGMADSLVHMVGRVDSPDLKYFVTAVLIQQETGGNLVELIEKIGRIIRARLNFKIKIRALTGDGRLSATVLTILPIFMFFVLLIVKPEYEAVLIYEPFGRTLLGGGIVFLLSGLYVLRKMVKSIEV
ncbi:MAG: type II secretion system F family protein [Desulfobacterales bacterium]|nr:type II secretion system F family protein [Pseudomonadota bacterium]MBU4354063.1 type II secretion system F family protein [Pseudomonadota bacterium]MCG2770541.1 type II secretion system F family protein [Desulfobacterales bacterium]